VKKKKSNMYLQVWGFKSSW